MKYEDSGKGLIGREGLTTMVYAKVEVEYPVCRKHGLWLVGRHIANLISLWGMILGWIIHYLLGLFFAGVFFWTVRLNPVVIRRVTAHFYTLIIRNEDYAREFAMLNNLNPI
jgi:hypothetical protein